MADAFVACAFFMPEVRGLRRGQAPLSKMGSGPFARDGGRHLRPRWGQAPSSAAGSGPFVCGGVRPLRLRRGQAPLYAVGSGPFVCGGVRHLCLRWGLTPEGIVTYLHLRFILRCFIIVGAGGSTNIA